MTVLRNTPPLTLLFFAVLLGLPRFGLVLPFNVFAVIALGCYTSAFICEVLRSGINTVPTGQGEAARSLGMTFGQSLGAIVLPQAFRSVIPPVARRSSRSPRTRRSPGGRSASPNSSAPTRRSTNWATASSGPSSGSPWAT